MKKNIIYILLFFLSFFIIFVLYKSLNKENVYIPERVLNEKISNFSSKDLFSENIINSKDFILKNKYSLINIWASWCLPCRAEHEILMEISKDESIFLIGINYKERSANAKSFLHKVGDPFDIIFTDKDGTLSINLGAVGVPETYIVNSDQEIIKRYIGTLSEKQFQEIKKIINK